MILTANKVAGNFVSHVLKLHGFPKRIISDWDKIFISKFWQRLFKSQGTTLSMSSSYHPQTNGQSEVLNKTLEMYLRCYYFDNPKNWVSMLSWAQYWYNTTFHTSIKMSPYEAPYDRDPLELVKYELVSQDEQNLQQMLIARDQLLEQLNVNMNRAQQYMKLFVNKHRRVAELEEKELVLVKLQPYGQHSVALRKNHKLGMRYFDPFPIIKN